MTESVFKRVKRIVSAKVEDSIDAMERSGGTAVMREAIRETDRAIEEVKRERDEVTVRRLQAVRQQKMFKDRLEALTEKAEYALSEDREDLARAALSRQVDFEAQIANLGKTESLASEQEREWEEALAELEVRKARMEEELSAFEAARAELGITDDNGSSSRRDAARKIDRAEAAFNRAMGGAGGSVGIAKVDVATASSLAELDTMQKNQEIDDRLNALRKKAS